MRLRLVSAVITLVVCTATHASCMRETLGDTICDQGPCSNDRNRKISCTAERFGTAARDDQGEIVRGLGSCVEDILSGQALFPNRFFVSFYSWLHRVLPLEAQQEKTATQR